MKNLPYFLNDTPRSGFGTPIIQAVRTLLLSLGWVFFLLSPPPADAQYKVLFIGNSFTAGSGGTKPVPEIFDALARAGGQADPDTVMRAVGGMDFEFHAGSADTLNAITSQQWTHVILQNFSTEPTHLVNGSHSIADHMTFGTQLYNQILANNEDTQVILYETFSRAEAHSLITGTSSPNSFASTAEFQREVRTNYAALAQLLTAANPDRLPVRVAPVGSAWEDAGGLLPSGAAGYVDLHAGDNYHGNDNGYYLAAAVFYATIFGESPEGLAESAEINALNLTVSTDAAALERAARGAVEAQAGDDEVLLIDFGADSDPMDPGDDGTNTWNNVTPGIGGTDDGELTGLLTTTGKVTGTNFVMVSRFNGANESGTTASNVFPIDATRDSLYANTEVFGGSADVFPSFKLSGLDPERAYSLTFYASRIDVGDNRETKFTVTGAAETVATSIPPTTDATSGLAGVAPSAGGEITIAISPGDNNDNGFHFTYLGVMKISYPGDGGPIEDTTPPELVSTNARSTELTVVFNEPLEMTSAETVSNFTVTADGDPVALDGADLLPDGRTVSLELVNRFIGPYTVTVSGVTDLAGNPIAPGSAIDGVAPDPDARFFLFDFGGDNFIDTDDDGNRWNNVTQGVADDDFGELFDIIDANGQSSDITLAMIRRFNGVNASGTPDNTDFPPQATGDSFYANTESFGGSANVFPSFKFTGLDPNVAYTFTIYASRMGAGDNPETRYTVTGANTSAVVLNPADNIDVTATVNAMVPTPEGEIVFAIEPTENNDNGFHFTYLGVLKMEVTAPASGLKITTQPESVTVDELDPATFQVSVQGEPPFTVQWSRNGAPIGGATDFSHTISSATFDLNGSVYTAVVSNAGGSVTSQAATLTIIPDQVPPVPLAATSFNGTTVNILFSEPLDPATAEIAANYAIADTTVTAAKLAGDGVTVELTLSPAVQGMFTVAVSGVTDRAGNAVADGSMVSGEAPVPGTSTFFFDFGGTATENDGVDDPDRFWNNVGDDVGTDDFGELFDIVTSTGEDSAMTLVMISRFNGTNNSGTTMHPSFPSTATGDSLYGNTEDWNGLIDIFPGFKLGNLNPSLEYTFTMYASRLGAGEERETGYTITGGNEGFGVLDPANNEVTDVTIAGIIPSVGGEITINIAPTENNLNSFHFTYLGIMRINAAPAGEARRFEITRIKRNAADSSIELTWTSTLNATYAIESSIDLDPLKWNEVEDSISSDGETTTRKITPAPDAKALYYRVRAE